MEYAEELIKLRLTVGYLGEKSNYNWWSSDFLSTTSANFLSPIFTRTTVLAKYNGVKEAAALKHDEFIGVGLVYHLFRLPEMFEQHLHEEIMNSNKYSTFDDKSKAFEILNDLSGSHSQGGEGPVYLGTLKELSANTIQKLASLYLTGFKEDKQVFPYFKEINED